MNVIIKILYIAIIKLGEKMKIRLGYVAISKTLENKTTSSAMTYTNFQKEENNYDKLYTIIHNNLNNLEDILNYNIKNNIHFYRLTSKLIPLATHNQVNYDYITPFQEKFKNIGKIIEKNQLRIDTHPDQYAVLNSINKNIVKNTIEILEYHYKILNALRIKNKLILLHIGGNHFGKEQSKRRFINNFNQLPKYLQKTIAIENDDKIFTIKDVLMIAKKIKTPVVLDYHHFICNNEGETIEEIIDEVCNTWKNQNPKMHFSSPKSKLKKEFRSHHDYIDSDSFIAFIKKIKFINRDIDIMIEAKAKDEALFRLVRELKYKTNFHFIDETTFEV